MAISYKGIAKIFDTSITYAQHLSRDLAFPEPVRTEGRTKFWKVGDVRRFKSRRIDQRIYNGGHNRK